MRQSKYHDDMLVGPYNIHLVRMYEHNDEVKYKKAWFECPECHELNLWRIDKVAYGTKKKCRKCNFKYFEGQCYGPNNLLLTKLLPNDRAQFRCICGKLFEANRHDVGTGHTRSCGCVRAQLSSERKRIDLIGMTFGRLTVKKRADKLPSGEQLWECACECGNTCYIPTGRLRNGTTKSCGCLQRERATEANRANLVNQRFGNLTVLRMKGTKETSSGANLVVWECECDCGRHVEAITSELKSGIKRACPYCSHSISYGERTIEEILNRNDINYVAEKSFDDCRSPYSNTMLRFDFYLPDNNMCIEFDGRQHFDGCSFGEINQYVLLYERDITKDEWCREHGIFLLRIPYTMIKKLYESDDILLSLINNQTNPEYPERHIPTDAEINTAHEKYKKYGSTLSE